MTGRSLLGVRLWVAGARPKTLGASVSPVLVGTAVASRYGEVIWARAALALVVAVALQVGVNYANDYSDGVRGVDSARRKGPMRLTASGLVAPGAVKRAAILSFAVAAVAGIALALAADWRLILVGAVCVLAGWLYSGGPKPYASAGLGEVMVLVFFGFVATVGSAYVHDRRLPALAFEAAVPMGLAASAILLVNNLRDVLSDRVAGKRTLAVRLGEPATRIVYLSCMAVTMVWPLLLGVTAPGAVAGLLAAPLAVSPMRTVAGHGGRATQATTKADAPALVGALVKTARFQLVLAALLAVGMWDW